MALSLLLRAAAQASVPVFVVAGSGSRAAADLLRLDDRLLVVDSPRHAMLLVVAGGVDETLGEPLRRLHDALPAPRSTIWWRRGSRTPPPVPALAVEGDQDIAAACVRLGHDLLAGTVSSDPPLLADVERHPWRGVGPYGQGGTGMTGGHPYGRALAGRADDVRDRLALDVVPLTVGPFFSPLPDGLVLRVMFQGDIVHELAVERAPRPPADHDDVFWTATARPVTVRDVERQRAASHLRWLARGLDIVGLPALAMRALRLAVQPDRREVGRLAAVVQRVVPTVARGVGPLAAEQVTGRGLGVVARASGLSEDARSGDPAYRALGFEPVVQHDGDVWARWRQRLDEAAQSLALAEGAGDTVTGGDGRPIEGPHGVIGVDRLTPLLELLPAWLQGLEWGDAVLAISSLDLHPDLDPVVSAEHR